MSLLQVIFGVVLPILSLGLVVILFAVFFGSWQHQIDKETEYYKREFKKRGIPWRR